MKANLLVISCLFVFSLYGNPNYLSGKKPKNPVQIEFDKGEASSARNFFEGLVNLIVQVDYQYRRFEYLDSIQTTPLKSFKKTSKTVLANIKYARKIFKKYSEPRWELQEKFLNLSFQWLDQIEYLTTVHLNPLLKKLTVPDDQWTKADIKKWENYSSDYETYYNVDAEWVEFQYIFADANHFELSGTINEEEMIRTEDED